MVIVVERIFPILKSGHDSWYHSDVPAWEFCFVMEGMAGTEEFSLMPKQTWLPVCVERAFHAGIVAAARL